jgi:hypothetical protein
MIRLYQRGGTIVFVQETEGVNNTKTLPTDYEARIALQIVGDVNYMEARGQLMSITDYEGETVDKCTGSISCMYEFFTNVSVASGLVIEASVQPISPENYADISEDLVISDLLLYGLSIYDIEVFEALKQQSDELCIQGRETPLKYRFTKTPVSDVYTLRIEKVGWSPSLNASIVIEFCQ